MASRKLAEERSIGEVLSKTFVADHLAGVSSTITSSLHLLRALNELQDDLSRHCAATYATVLRSRPGAPARLSSLSAAASAVADARVRIVDACYGELDVAVNALDRRLKLTEAVLKLHGQGLGEEGGEGAGGLASLARPRDAISSRVGRRAAAGSDDEGGGGGGGGAASAAAASSSAPSIALKFQLAAATGSGLGGAPSPGALDLAIGSHEPMYCHCRQVAFGEMIACESESCAVEWFHFSCVGISAATRPAFWMCPACRAAATGGGGGSSDTAGSGSGTAQAQSSKKRAREH